MPNNTQEVPWEGYNPVSFDYGCSLFVGCDRDRTVDHSDWMENTMRNTGTPGVLLSLIDSILTTSLSTP